MNDKICLVETDEIKISSSDKPIIATYSIATCIAILLYIEEFDKAIIYHTYSRKNNEDINTRAKEIFSKINTYLKYLDVLNKKIQYAVIQGTYGFDIKKDLKNKLELSFIKQNYLPLDIKQGDIKIDKNDNLEFAFNSITGVFVSNEVFKNDDDYNIANIKVR